MANILAIVSKAVFEKEGRRVNGTPLKIGDTYTTSKYSSTSKHLTPLSEGGSLYLVVVRPGDQLWLVAKLEKLVLQDDGWVAAEKNTVSITDISGLINLLQFSTGKGIRSDPGKLGMSLQTPRVLTENDVKLIDAAHRGVMKPTSAPLASSPALTSTPYSSSTPITSTSPTNTTSLSAQKNTKPSRTGKAPLAMKPLNPDTMFKQAEVLCTTHAFQDALDLYEKLEPLEQTRSRAKVGIGSCLAMLGKRDEALARLDKWGDASIKNALTAIRPATPTISSAAYYIFIVRYLASILVSDEAEKTALETIFTYGNYNQYVHADNLDHDDYSRAYITLLDAINVHRPDRLSFARSVIITQPWGTITRTDFGFAAIKRKLSIKDLLMRDDIDTMISVAKETKDRPAIAALMAIMAARRDDRFMTVRNEYLTCPSSYYSDYYIYATWPEVIFHYLDKGDWEKALSMIKEIIDNLSDQKHVQTFGFHTLINFFAPFWDERRRELIHRFQKCITTIGNEARANVQDLLFYIKRNKLGIKDENYLYLEETNQPCIQLTDLENKVLSIEGRIHIDGVFLHGDRLTICGSDGREIPIKLPLIEIPQLGYYRWDAHLDRLFYLLFNWLCTGQISGPERLVFFVAEIGKQAMNDRRPVQLKLLSPTQIDDLDKSKQGIIPVCSRCNGILFTDQRGVRDEIESDQCPYCDIKLLPVWREGKFIKVEAGSIHDARLKNQGQRKGTFNAIYLNTVRQVHLDGFTIQEYLELISKKMSHDVVGPVSITVGNQGFIALEPSVGSITISPAVWFSVPERKVKSWLLPPGPPTGETNTKLEPRISYSFTKQVPIINESDFKITIPLHDHLLNKVALTDAEAFGDVFFRFTGFSSAMGGGIWFDANICTGGGEQVNVMVNGKRLHSKTVEQLEFTKAGFSIELLQAIACFIQNNHGNWFSEIVIFMEEVVKERAQEGLGQKLQIIINEPGKPTKVVKGGKAVKACGSCNVMLLREVIDGIIVKDDLAKEQCPYCNEALTITERQKKIVPVTLDFNGGNCVVSGKYNEIIVMYRGVSTRISIGPNQMLFFFQNYQALFDGGAIGPFDVKFKVGRGNLHVLKFKPSQFQLPHPWRPAVLYPEDLISF